MSDVLAENRRLRRGVAVLSLALVVVLGAGAKRSEVKQADRYELVDDQGIVRGVMGTLGDQPYLRLNGDDGSGVTVTTQGGEVSLSMYTDSPRHPRVHVLAGSSGSEVSLLDRNGVARARVELLGNGDVVAITRDASDPLVQDGDVGTSALQGLVGATPR